MQTEFLSPLDPHNGRVQVIEAFPFGIRLVRLAAKLTGLCHQCTLIPNDVGGGWLETII